jgi:hypothetical protein
MYLGKINFSSKQLNWNFENITNSNFLYIYKTYNEKIGKMNNDQNRMHIDGYMVIFYKDPLILVGL